MKEWGIRYCILWAMGKGMEKGELNIVGEGVNGEERESERESKRKLY